MDKDQMREEMIEALSKTSFRASVDAQTMEAKIIADDVVDGVLMPIAEQFLTESKPREMPKPRRTKVNMKGLLRSAFFAGTYVGMGRTGAFPAYRIDEAFEAWHEKFRKEQLKKRDE